MCPYVQKHSEHDTGLELETLGWREYPCVHMFYLKKRDTLEWLMFAVTIQMVALIVCFKLLPIK